MADGEGFFLAAPHPGLPGATGQDGKYRRGLVMAHETVRLIEYAGDCAYEDLPPDVVQRAKGLVSSTRSR